MHPISTKLTIAPRGYSWHGQKLQKDLDGLPCRPACPPPAHQVPSDSLAAPVEAGQGMGTKRPCYVCWSSFFGHRDRLFDCRLLLKGIGRQVAQFGVQPHAVVEAHDIVGDVCHGLGVVGVVALPDPLCLEA